MAESSVFSLASEILSTITSPAFNMAYEKGLSIWEGRDELAKLRVTIETIQAVLLDAEKKQQGSAAVKNWIKRLKDVLYDADDLFDEVATDDLLEKQIIKGKDKVMLKKVRLSCSMLNPVISRNSIAKKVKAIRESLLEISKDMAGLGFVRGQHGEAISSMRIGQDPGSFVDPKYVFGRDGDKKVILDMLFNESNDAKHDTLVVIAIVGIGGMGKTTLAQLIYNEDEVKKNFGNKWFACISDISDEKEVLGKIFQSMCEGSYTDLTISQLQTKIRESINGKKFLLVLDDVWDEDHAQWQHRLSLLGGGAKGSKIVVTTRSSSVAKVVDAFETHTLGGLSEEASWDLFKRVAFTPERENDRRWTDVGRDIVKKCARVPLAIRSIGSLLYTKTTIREWEFFKDQELSKIEERGGQDQIMSVLKLSYHHLPSSMKNCFAYCSLFPKDYEFDVRKLIYIWIAQGYIRSKEDEESVEEIGYSYFMSLLRRSFFQEAEENSLGEIIRCKMHDLVHDLAQHVAGEEIVMLTKPSSQRHSVRHVHIDCGLTNAGEIMSQVLNMTKLRSFMLMIEGWDVDQQLKGYKWLRALSLSKMRVANVPSCIGELKLLKYLDLSSNNFERLPDSMTNLLNLLALDLAKCDKLKALPGNFRKLINLRYLNIRGCNMLEHMPAGFAELGSLQYLSHFKVGEVEVVAAASVKTERSGLDALSELQKLRGELNIVFARGLEEEDWDGDECWKLPTCPQELCIYNYPGMRLPYCANISPSQLPNFVRIRLDGCYKVKYLPPLRCLPYLKRLTLHMLYELEYIEEEEEEEGDMHSSFFPCLEFLKLSRMPKLKGWSRRMNNHHDHVVVELERLVQQRLWFPLLSRLCIKHCPELKYMPPCPRICGLELDSVGGLVIEQLLSSSGSSLKQIHIQHCRKPFSFLGATLTSLQDCHIFYTGGLKILHLASPHLQRVYIWKCNKLTSVEVATPTTSLSSFQISFCSQLKNLRIAYPNVLKELRIFDCRELVLSTGVDWDSLPNLRSLRLHRLLGELPQPPFTFILNPLSTSCTIYQPASCIVFYLFIYYICMLIKRYAKLLALIYVCSWFLVVNLEGVRRLSRLFIKADSMPFP